MPTHAEPHAHACDCAAHRAPRTAHARHPGASSPGLWAAALPFLACAVCPACLTTYTKLFSVLGISVGLSELHHLVLLLVALTASIGVSAWRSWRSRRVWPLAIALTGSTLVAAGHFSGELHALEWAGVVTLLAGGLIEHFRLRRTMSLAPAAA